MTLVLYTFVFALGCCIGSFLNVCIYRLPREMSLVNPGSHCPSCNESIAWYDNVPVLSWLWLRGLCRRCGVLISRRYLLVELLAGAVFVWLYAAHRSSPSGSALAALPTLGAYVVVASALIAASFVDVEHMVIPDEISIGGMYVGPIVCAICPQVIQRDDLITEWLVRVTGASGSAHLGGLAASVIGMAAGAAVVYAAAVFGKTLFRKEAMGFGDVKFLGMAGAFIGWQGVVLAFFVACVYGAAVGIVLLVRRRDTHIPFGPYLAAGVLTVMLHKAAMLEIILDIVRAPQALAVIRSWFA